MADTYLEVSSGSGTKLAHESYTDSNADTVLDQKARIGLPYLPTYTLSVSTAISMATANEHLLQIMAGAANRLTLLYLCVTQVAIATAAAVKEFALFRLTTAGTGGTAVTPRAANPATGAVDGSAMTLPTAKGTEGNQLWTGTGLVFFTVPTTGQLWPLVCLDWRGALRSQAPEIAAGTSNGLALKIIPSDAGAPTVRIYAEFFERSYT